MKKILKNRSSHDEELLHGRLKNIIISIRKDDYLQLTQLADRETTSGDNKVVVKDLIRRSIIQFIEVANPQSKAKNIFEYFPKLEENKDGFKIEDVPSEYKINKE